MNFWDRVLFNIFINSTVSFLFASLFAYTTVKVFRFWSPEFKLYFLSLPVVKVISDCIRGIPAESALWTELKFNALPSSLVALLKGTVGLSWNGLTLALKFGIENATPKAGDTTLAYTLSLSEVLYWWFVQHLGPVFFCLILGSIFLVGCLRFIRRLVVLIIFEYQRAKQRILNGTQLMRVQMTLRKIDVYLSNSHFGSPFTGGFIYPYICFPKNAFEILNEQERLAVIQHEQNHVARLDVLQCFILNSLGDFFWFLPVFKNLEKMIDQLRELVADDQVELGDSRICEPRIHLASTLLKLKTLEFNAAPAAVFSVQVTQKKFITRRIARLLATDETPTHNKKFVQFINLFAIILLSIIVLSSSILGN